MTLNLTRDTAHFNMLEQQVRPTDVTDARLLDALRFVKRADFLGNDLAGLAFADTPLPIGFGQTMLPPILQSKMLQALTVKADDTVLEIGSGTGYFTALLALLAKQVDAVEIVPELAEITQHNLQAMGLNNVSVHVGDASMAWPLDERVDIIVSTAAFVTVPEGYLHQLQLGGRLLAIVGEGQSMEVLLISRVAERQWQTTVILETVIPAMINAEPQPEFIF
jgi:protein-L-isoaspartate(D-aspartate) O-methyltransferase